MDMKALGGLSIVLFGMSGWSVPPAVAFPLAHGESQQLTAEHGLRWAESDAAAQVRDMTQPSPEACAIILADNAPRNDSYTPGDSKRTGNGQSSTDTGYEPSSAGTT